MSSTSSALATQQPSDPNSSFIHPPLDKSREQIRLVRILANAGHEIRAELRTFELFDNTVSWKALSYCWGDDEATAYIVVGNECFNQWFRVRPKLYDFLVQIKLEIELGWFFIDAICIDQNSLYERNHQVGLMGDIYKRASEVIVWISMRGDNDSLQSQIRLRNLRLQDDWWSQVKAEKLAEEMFKTQASVALRNEYWSRSWVVQEVLLAQSITIRYGQLTLSLSLYYQVPKESVIDVLYERISSEDDQFPNRNPLYTNLEMSQNILGISLTRSQALQSGNYIAFHEAMIMFSTQRCRSSHDKVFSLLGITQSVIFPDYSMSIMELYAATLTQCLISMGFDCETAEDFTRDYTELGLLPQELKDTITKVGNALYTGFNLDPYHSVVFGMTDSVLSCFGQGFVAHSVAADDRPNWFILSNHMHFRLMHDFLIDSYKYSRDISKPWYTIQLDREGKQAYRYCSRLEALIVQAKVSKICNILLAAPDGESREWWEWNNLGLATCQEIRRRHENTQELREVSSYSWWS